MKHITRQILAVLLTVFLTSCIPAAGEFEPQLADSTENKPNTSYPAPVTPVSNNTVKQAYPPPNISIATPLPLAESPQTGQETVPWPTFTPIPTLTPQPGATPTALALNQPIPSTDENIIIYFAQQENNSLLPLYTEIIGGKIAPAKTILANNETINISSPVSIYPSPDGKRIILTNGWGIRYIINVDTGRVQLLFKNILDPKGQSFNWHPDSRHFLMEAQEGTQETGLWLVDTETGKYSVLLHQFPTPRITAGAVSPSGQQIVYALENPTNRNYEVWVADINGNNAKLIWESKADVNLFAWSPDGRYLAMNGGRVMDMNNYQVKTMTQNMAEGYGYAFRPVWSPDSYHIAFIAFDTPNPLTDKSMPPEEYSADIFKGANIHILNIKTGEEKPLIQEKGTGHVYPSWSPDGTQIAFASTINGKPDIWISNIDGTKLRQLTDTEWPVYAPYWTTSLSGITR